MQEHDEENEEQGTSVIRRWLGDLRHHIVLFCVLTLLETTAVFVLHKYFEDSLVTEWVTKPAVVAGTALLILASTSYIGEFLGILSRRFSKVARGSGLEDFLPHTSRRRAKRDWAACTSRIKDEKPERLRILVFTGASTFARKDTPLHWALKKYEKDLQILLALPGCPAFERVIKMLRDDRSSESELRQRYHDQHRDANAFCRSLAEARVPHHLRSIEVRGYEWPVIWKMVAFHNYLWLQHYCHSRSVDETPAYIIREPSSSSLFIPFQSVFNSHWDSATVLLKYDGQARVNNWDKATEQATVGI